MRRRTHTHASATCIRRVAAWPALAIPFCVAMGVILGSHPFPSPRLPDAGATVSAPCAITVPTSPAPANPGQHGGPPAPARFVHPCIPLTIKDLDTIKACLDREPWKSGYTALARTGQAQLTYKMAGPFQETKRNPNVNLWPWRNDMVAVYNLARMWYFTGNAAYAQKARDILIAWATTHTNFGGNESGLDLGDYAICYGGGASILRGTWPGWTADDTATVQGYFQKVLWPASLVGTHVPGPANKGALYMAAGIAIATFCDDREKFAYLIDLFRTSHSAGLPNSLPTGEMGETGRDTGHSYGNLVSLALVAEVAWKQGIDLYSEMDNRLLACGEYYARNTMTTDNPFVPFGTIDYHYWVNAAGPHPSNRTAFYILQNAYKNRLGLPTPWMDRKLEEQAIDGANFMFARTSDPSTATPLPPVRFPEVTLASGGLTLTTLGSQTAHRAATYQDGVWTVTGLGNGTWNDSSDDCQFVSTAMTGDGAMVAQVTSCTFAGNNNGKAGLMIRDRLDATVSQRGWIGIVPATPNRFEAYMSGWTANWGGRNWAKRSQPLPPGMPYWLKIERRGGMITTFASQDGTSWAAVTNSHYANLPPVLHIGLFVSSGTATPVTATFANVAFTGGTGGRVKPPAAPAALFAVGPDDAITVRWLPSFGATAYDLLRSTTAGSGHAVIAGNLASGRTSFVDTTAAVGTTYHYVVRARNAVGVSGHSPPFSAMRLAPMTRLAVGGTATASINGDSAVEGARQAFDRNPGSKWLGNATTGWIQYDFGAGNAQTVTRYTVSCADVAARDPKSWRFLASQDGATWTTLDTQGDQSFAYRMRMNAYDLGNTTAYRYYRLDITANHGASAVAVAEFGLWSGDGRTQRGGRN